MLNRTKKHAMALAALTIAIGSVTLMSFKSEKSESSFYEYTSSSTSKTDLEDVNNYKRSTPSCEPGEHVCGVLLPTDNGIGNSPTPTEFDAIKDQLWSAEQNGSTTNANILMKE